MKLGRTIASLAVFATLAAWGCSRGESEGAPEPAASDPTPALSIELPDAETASRAAELCKPFAEALAAVPHTVLTVRIGDLESLWDRKPFAGCEVEFETTDSLSADVEVPTFDAFEGTEMHANGWRPIHGIGADGPGSGIFGIERDSTACIIRWSQPAYIDDAGEDVQSETLSMTIQCRAADA